MGNVLLVTVTFRNKSGIVKEIGLTKGKAENNPAPINVCYRPH